MSIMDVLFRGGRVLQEEPQPLEEADSSPDVTQIEKMKCKIDASINSRNWTSLGRLYVAKGKLYQDFGDIKKSLENYILSYYIEINGGNDKVGIAAFDDVFSEFEPGEPENSIGKALSMEIIKTNNLKYKQVKCSLEKGIKHFHDNFNFPISHTDFSKKITTELFI